MMLWASLQTQTICEIFVSFWLECGGSSLFPTVRITWRLLPCYPWFWFCREMVTHSVFLMKMRVKMEKVQSEFTRSKFRTEAKGDLALPFWTLHCGEKKMLRFISFESSVTEHRWHNVEVISNQWGFFSSSVWNLWRKKKADTDTNKPYQNCACGPGHFDSGTVFIVISKSFLQMQT